MYYLQGIKKCLQIEFINYKYHGSQIFTFMFKMQKLSKMFVKSFSVNNKVSNKKIFMEKGMNKLIMLKNNLSNINTSRFNEINLQMLSSNLYNQIFGSDSKKVYAANDINLIKKNLKSFGIDTKRRSEIPNVNVLIPKLEGTNIEEHFKQIASQQIKSYLEIIYALLEEIPEVPKYFVLKEGWTRYTNSEYEAVEYPQELGLIYDIEVCLKNGPLPIMATAVSTTAWYGWVSKDLINGTSGIFKNYLTPDHLIPLESTTNDKGLSLNSFQQMPKIIVGHNVSFDRVRTKEQYWLNGSATRFLDTLALHICISGTNSYQRTILKSKNNVTASDQLKPISSLNNLADVYNFYCGKTLDKTNRKIFVDGDLLQIKNQFNTSMQYCALDVIATHNILKKLFPIFIERFPHPATLAGMLELGSTYLPVNYNWNRYLQEAETTYEDMNLESKTCLSKRADLICRLLIGSKYKNDPWLWDEDWSIKQMSLKKGYIESYNEMKNKFVSHENKELCIKFKYLENTKTFLPKKIPYMSGYPNWYRRLCQKSKNNINCFSKSQNISTSMLISPKLLNLTWTNYPLHYIREHGWGFLVPFENKNLNLTLFKRKNLDQFNLTKTFSFEIKSFSEFTLIKEKFNRFLDQHLSNNLPEFLNNKHFIFFKLPHKNGVFCNVGNPLAKDFFHKFSENILAGTDKNAARILSISKMSSYWKNSRDRILSQVIVWLHDKPQNINSKINANLRNYGAIIPQVIVSGTLTRRATEGTWMTASNAHSERIGSELRAMINAPLNYNIIGADVDSQELWIASILGDSFSKTIKIQGGTPFSWMTLIGSKSEGTDMHSVTAKTIGISRDEAKILNYARIYGAGQKFSERLLKQFNSNISDKEAMSKSKKMFQITKGQKLYRLKDKYLSKTFINKLYTTNEAIKIASLYGKNKKEIFEKGKWFGGSESTMFNSLEEIVEQEHPATPFLNSRLSQALEYEKNENYLPTRINWVVQSAAVDFLHLMLVNMRWLMKDKARLCLSFHDEVRYLVPSKYKYNAALAMHVTNLLVRSFFVSKLKMKDLPMSVAFFTAVEVDSVLRKEAAQDYKTPSNPHGLQEGYGINYGESLNIWTAIEKSNGRVGLINNNK